MVLSPVINLSKHVSTTCIICGEKSSLLSECRDLSSWTKLLEAAQIRKHEGILSIPIGENELPSCPVTGHADQHLPLFMQISIYLQERTIKVFCCRW